MRLIVIALATTLAFGQFHQENISFSKREGDVGQIRVKKAYAMMALGYEALYGLTSPEHVVSAYEAGIAFQKYAEKKNSPQPFPKFSKKMLRKHPDEVRDDGFMLGLLASNQGLNAVLRTTQPGETRRNMLMNAYLQYPFHSPTLLAIAENERVLGHLNTAMGWVRRVNSMEERKAYWPLLVTEASIQRDMGQFEIGMDLLKDASKLSYFKLNPAAEMMAAWTKEQRDAAGDPRALFDIGDASSLSKLAKDDPEAGFMLGQLYDKRLHKSDAFDAYKKAYERSDGTMGEALLRAIQAGDPTASQGLARRALKEFEDGETDPWTRIAASMSSTLELEERQQILKSVIDEHPENVEALKQYAYNFRKAGDDEALERTCERLIEMDDTSESVTLMIGMMENQGRLERAGQAFVTHFDRFHDDTTFLYRGSRLVKDNPNALPQAAKDRLGYELMRKGMEYANRFDFSRAADLVGYAKRAWPDQKGLSLLAANILTAGRQKSDAIEPYQESIEEFPGEPCLYELLGDAYFDADQMGKTLDAYARAQELDASRALLEPKIEMAKKRRRQKITTGIISVLAVASFALAPPSGQRSRGVRLSPTGPSGHQSFGHFGLPGGASDSPASGYGIDETKPLLLDLYSHYLDMEDAYAK